MRGRAGGREGMDRAEEVLKGRDMVRDTPWRDAAHRGAARTRTGWALPLYLHPVPRLGSLIRWRHDRRTVPVYSPRSFSCLEDLFLPRPKKQSDFSFPLHRTSLPSDIESVSMMPYPWIEDNPTRASRRTSLPRRLSLQLQLPRNKPPADQSPQDAKPILLDGTMTFQLSTVFLSCGDWHARVLKVKSTQEAKYPRYAGRSQVPPTSSLHTIQPYRAPVPSSRGASGRFRASSRIDRPHRDESRY
ncbi:hypothetical protein LXA43DRAFT_25426 [Ganoderma leucocontextum]|nr:hypothetical protein LXA43DRAFT_25426 [Ganoderma leucocontextum]